ncbi:MAG: hypothetical protein LQ342_002451 [Letrouitia transgressa]|nr:MAG: hypothetical protein LQ342_002451 [Letrouitia transgressa]
MARQSRSGSARSRKLPRHNPLSEDIANTGPLNERTKKRKSRSDADEDQYVDPTSSGKILRIGQELAHEDREENGSPVPNPAFAFESRFSEGSDQELRTQDDDAEETWGDDDEEAVNEVEIDPNDLNLFNKFMPDTTSQDHMLQSKPSYEGQTTNLADLILEKIAAREAADAGAPSVHGGGPLQDAVELPPKVVEVYSKIGLFMSRYKSGKLPKPFKILPSLPQWQDLLAITRPESWTANACYEATRIFISSKPYVSQVFLETVILERVREDIHETRKLNVHLYKALKKALYRPAAFFKGFLFPLVNGGTCTQREAQIISSVLVKVSIPVLHSAAALLRLTEISAEQISVSTESSGATNIFMRVLLEKKYALPYKVIDALVFHFLRFRASPQADTASTIPNGPSFTSRDLKLPVLWHQCLLSFAQRYRNDITEDQREALLDLLLIRGHKDIGPEVRRELLEGRGRGVVMEPVGFDGGDDTMAIDP